MPIITYIIIGISVFFSISAFSDRQFFNRNLFSPYLIRTNKEWHRFFTHAILHADYMHLIFNMYALYMFGEIVERNFMALFGKALGEFYYTLLYVGGVVLSSYPSFEKHKNNSYYSAVGASGAVSAVVFGAIFMHPTMSMGLILIPIMIPAFIFGLLYLAFSWYMAKKAIDNIGHDAHFWGSVYGILFCIAVNINLLYRFISEIKVFFNLY